MAGKITGLGWTTWSVDDSGGSARALINDVTDVSISTPRATQDVTGLDKSGVERRLLLADVAVTSNGVMNVDDTTSAYAVFKTVPSTSVARTTTMTIAAKTLAPELLYTDFGLARSATGEFTWTAPGALADGTVPTWT